jgi:chorismate dehydratase
MLAHDEVQAALVPVIEYQRINDLMVVPRVCVGSQSSVKSVVIVTRDPVRSLKDVRTMALDVSSRTSVALVQIIFREFLGFEPEWRRHAPDASSMLEEADAALIIGDPGMSFSRQQRVVYDLAELWREHTGLGFVFAMWMARARELEKVRRVDFAGARDEGLEHVEEIASHYTDAVGLSPAQIKSYLLENISFEMNEEMSAGLSLFYRLAEKHGIIPEARPLRWIGA